MNAKSLAVAAGLAMLASSASAALVTNGGFEDVSGLADGGKNRGSYGVYNSIPGWTKSSGSGIELQDNGTLGTIDANTGNWYVELDSDENSSMYQDVTFASAGDYVLSFFYAPRTSTIGDNGITYSVAGALSGFVDDVFPAGWREVKSVFTVASAGTLRLTFTAGGLSNSLGGFIDDVSIAPVPVPAAGLMLMGGLAGLGAFARRRRQA
ncbi:VPLPA-CTERM sorting domain-containing protein [Paracoccus sp. TK19116]|uniref:VPLPA-CTERM sorting domain-containing protein n=1 Tax=Paracoccus albicereus TaxID=2922394 RepID=A0ABT1MQG9_9RHOB|nr:VPLPA-CTERM sorting domain-containing protein [Paracoccus albicereus]MCQ0970374.1 VPLPA-CTERM sorting domain-containing protein [Paracoccus albicereus]